MPLRRLRTVRTASLAAVALTPLLAVGLLAPPAAAAPPSPPAPPTTTIASSGQGGATHRLTLITGDVVTVTDAGGGRQAASIDRAPGRERVTFSTTQVDGRLSVIPSDAVPFLSAGVVDDELFDVTTLIADGYAGRDTLPLIVAYTDPTTSRRAPVDSTTTTRALPSIGGAALAAKTDSLSAVWSSLTPGDSSIARAPQTGQAATLNAGISHLWLDGRVHTTLDQSVGQIGGHDAWAAGYEGQGVEVAVLDTGIDATHPDLTAQISAQRDFSGSTTGTVDHFGHGTHVASTIAGTGAASGGRERGVAPASSLIIGKVLGDDGYGQDSWIIDGMQWAADEGARVVNMSLGGDATDGTDPIALALNAISEKSGALFVVAAGNEGKDVSVGSPGSASDALTVAAVDKDGQLADFSSRGPRFGDFGLKPEISAPGVDILAARAAGTAMGTPVDRYYTLSSGTSMATPHVAGAAALLAQQHPEWTWRQLKDALVSTATPNPKLNVWQQGAGQVDLRRAIPSTITATATADFANITADAPLARTVAYSNSGDAPVTLALGLQVADVDDARATTTAFTAPKTVTVPARGTAEVAISLDAKALAQGRWSGRLTASAEGTVVTGTAVGAVRKGPIHRVTIRAVDFRGKDAASPAVTLFGDHPGTEWMGFFYQGGPLQWDVEEGSYLLHGLVPQYDAQDDRVAEVVNPNLVIDRDMTIVLDARKAKKIEIRTPKPAERLDNSSYYVHRVYGNGRDIQHGVMEFAETDVYVTPTAPVKDGSFEFSSRWQLAKPSALLTAPGVTGSGPGGGPIAKLLPESPVFDGPRTLPLVAANPGLTGVKGKVVVFPAGNRDTESEGIAAAAAAGAAAAIVTRPADDSIRTVFHPEATVGPIPAMVTTAVDGGKLIARAKAGKATIRLDLTRSSPYLYDVQQVSAGNVPSQIVHTVSKANSQRITARYADSGGFPWVDEQRFTWRPWMTYAWNDTHRIVPTPSVREEWVSSGDSLWQKRVSPVHDTWNWGALRGGFTHLPRTYETGRSSESWLSPVVTSSTVADVPSFRQNDVLSLRIPELVDPEGHWSVGDAGTVSGTLTRDGQKVASLPSAVADVETSANIADYRLDLSTVVTKGASPTIPDEEWRWSTSSQTSWWFRSGRPSGSAFQTLPLLRLGYAAPVDDLGMATMRAHTLPITVTLPNGSTPKATTAKVWLSIDHGASWTPAPVVRTREGFSATVPKGTGPVSIRVEASTDATTRIRQTVIDAYGRH